MGRLRAVSLCRSRRKGLPARIYITSLLLAVGWTYCCFFTQEAEQQAPQRRLLQEDESISLPPLMPVEAARSGGILLHLLITIYMFTALAIVCDDYFVASLEVICERFEISDDVAGATFMAAGGSAPELFTSLVTTLIVPSDVGFGTIIGSAVFNVLFVIAMCAFFAGQILELTWYPLFRDCTYYCLCLVALVLVVMDQAVNWWESLILLFMYVGYVVVMKHNDDLKRLLYSIVKPKDEAFASNKQFQMSKEPKLILDVLSHRKSTDAGVNQSIQMSNVVPSPVAGGWTNGAASAEGAQNGEKSMAAATSQPQANGANGDATPAPTQEAQAEAPAEAEEAGGFPPMPDDMKGRVIYVILLPINFLLYFTIPNCSLEGKEKLYLITFTNSIIWIGLFTYVMVSMAEQIGTALYIPDAVMGVTLLAAGTSVPDALSSVIVAKEGHGDMAVSSSIGSNVFDITFGLPVPWLIRTGIIWPGSTVRIFSGTLWISVTTLLLMVVLLVVLIHFCGWKINHKLGGLMIALYFVFVTETLLLEYGIIKA